MRQQIVIEPRRSLLRVDWRGLYRYRDLLRTLARRDLKVSYSQTLIGIAWLVINPVFTILMLTFAFGAIARIDTGGVPHLLFTISGMCTWAYFASVTNQAGYSMVSAQDIIRKVYFPKLLLPISKAIVYLVDFAVIFACLLLAMLAYRFAPSANIVYLPLFLLLIIIVSLGAGIWVSALTIRFRDLLHVVPFLLRLGLFVTPIAYPADRIPENFRFLYYLNPLTGIVEGTRWSILGGPFPGDYLYFSIAFAMLLLFSGIIFFNKVDGEVADLV
jgi:lipopolysaccharide transport system permease protein